MATSTFSPQDLEDLKSIRDKLPTNHPTAAKIDATIQEAIRGAAPSMPVPKGLQGPPNKVGGLSPGEETGFGSRIKEFGKGALSAITSPMLHPQDTLEGLGKSMMASGSASGNGYPTHAPLLLSRTGREANEANNEVHRQQHNEMAEQNADMIASHPAHLSGSIAAPIMVGGALKAIPKVMGRVPAPVELSPTESSSRTLATRLTNSAKEAPGVSSTLSNQLDTIKRTVPSISPKQGLLDLSKAAQTAAENDKYLSNVIEPHKDLPTASGQTVGEAHGELAKLNAKLHPMFNRGGAGSTTAQATIKAGKAAEWNARAEQLRNEIADAVGKKTGVDPAYIKGLRRNYEQLNDIAWRADVSDYAHRMGLRDPAIPTSRMGLIERGLSKLPFNNPNAAVAKTFNSYEAAPEAEVPGMKLTGPDLFKPQVQHPVITSNPELPRLFDVVDNSAASKAYLEGLAKKRANVKPIGGKE